MLTLKENTHTAQWDERRPESIIPASISCWRTCWICCVCSGLWYFQFFQNLTPPVKFQKIVSSECPHILSVASKPNLNSNSNSRSYRSLCALFFLLLSTMIILPWKLRHEAHYVEHADAPLTVVSVQSTTFGVGGYFSIRPEFSFWRNTQIHMMNSRSCFDFKNGNTKLTPLAEKTNSAPPIYTYLGATFAKSQSHFQLKSLHCQVENNMKSREHEFGSARGYCICCTRGKFSQEPIMLPV
jgi:hypothetical protein